MSKIETEILEVTKVSRKDGEDDQVFFRRVFDKANALSDAVWEKLSEATQKWVNAAGQAVEGRDPLPSFDGEVKGKAKSKTNAEEDAEDGEAAEAAGAKKETKSKTEAKAKKETVKSKAKTAETAAETKTKAKAKAANGKKGRPGAYADDAKIKVLVKENPKRGASAKRFAKYKTGQTVAEAVKAGVLRADLRFDVAAEYIAVA